ncbi:hypothetical protein KY315_02400, partial [Candidatus Woesearchaeota archaeon]|nr:hypothetical protein [Candidatus Woesearchaeota archaeon]
VGYKRPEDDILESQTIRKYPVLHNLSKARRSIMENFIEDYQNFLGKLSTPMDVVDEVVRRAKLKKRGKDKKWFTFQEGFHPTQNYFIVDREGTNFAIVKYGQRGKPYVLEAGLKVLFAHTDSPCLMVKARPERFEWDPDLKELYSGARLDTIPYGGVHPYQWLGRTVYLTGWTITKNGVKKRIKPRTGYIPDFSPHINSSARQTSTSFNEAFSMESLDVILGNESKKSMREFFGMNCTEDWASSRIFVVPYANPRMLDNYFMTGYGHDDRACVFAAMRALFRSKPKHTCVFFGFDKEEIGSHGISGAQGKFFENVINELAYGEDKQYWSIKDLGYRVDRIIDRSLAISADVDIGSTHAEIDEIDRENVARMGYGPFIKAQDGACDDNQISPITVRTMRNLVDGRKKIRCQFIGSPHKADEVEGVSTMSIDFTNRRGLETVDAGIGVGSLHSPEEILNGGDLYWCAELYQTFFESDS